MTKGKKIWLIIGCSILGLLLLLAAAALTIWFINDFTLRVTMNGETEMVIEYGTAYEELGATADFSGTLLVKEPIPLKVTIQSDVDAQVLGVYTVTYTAKYKKYETTAVRTVRVVDTTAPEITLVTDPEAFTIPGNAYQEEGFSAADTHDGDVTAQVQRTEADGKVTYTVADAAGNVAVAERTIVYKDPIPPKITLKGGVVELMAGGKYVEPGFSANDNCDGDITSRVTVSNPVDVYRPGTYTVSYTVADSYENTDTVTRKVTVKPYDVSQVVVPNGKVIYLTFDDGPSAHTAELLDVLKKYNVKATFFVVNTSKISMIKRAAQEGHTVAVHSVTHDFKTIYASEEAYFKDLYKMQEIIRNYTGKTTKILRFPGGSSNTISKFNKGIMTRLAAAVEAQGYRYFDWNVDSNDAGGAKTANQVFNNVVKGIGNKKYAVVLQHDTHGFSVDAVERIINWGLSQGYTFLPLTESSPACEHNIRN